MPKPNILIFMVDQLTAFALKAYGGSVCKTPHFGAFAEQGALFENAYCPYPLCAPSRYALMTGRLPSRIGAYDNAAEFKASTPTFAHYLRLRGYYTALCGKMHFVGPDQYHGFEERLTTEIYPADFSWTPLAGDQECAVDDERRYAAGVSTIDTVLDAGAMARSMQIDYDDEVIHRAERELYTRARSADNRPFLLTVSLTHPHDPYVITKPYWDRYRDEDIDPPRVGFVPLAERDPHSQSLYYHYGQDKTEITPADYRRARRAYYGMVSYVDDLFGRVMAALHTSGFADDTVVLLTSDHGDMLGERGMWFKKTLFEPAIRIPLVMSHPGRGAVRVETPVSLVDVFPTLMDVAGVCEAELKTPVDGRSLLPGFDGALTPAPIFVEHIDGGTVSPRVMVRDRNLKLVYSNAYPSQLYDLHNDPDERNNLAGTAHYARDESRLGALVAQTWALDDLTEQVYADQTARKLIDDALSTGRRESWDFVATPLPQHERYVRHGDAFPDIERRGYLRYRND